MFFQHFEMVEFSVFEYEFVANIRLIIVWLIISERDSDHLYESISCANGTFKRLLTITRDSEKNCV